MRVTLSFWLTRICKARSPSVRATWILWPCGSRRTTSAANSPITAALPLVRLAHPLVLRPWGRRLVRAGGWFSAKKTFHNLLGSANPRGSGEHRGHRGHLLAVGLLPFGPP